MVCVCVHDGWPHWNARQDALRGGDFEFQRLESRPIQVSGGRSAENDGRGPERSNRSRHKSVSCNFSHLEDDFAHYD
jgi:hypothetical protein